MAINLRKFKTESEFSSAYTGDTYVEPWVSYVEETSGIVYNKVHLLGVEIKNLKMAGDVPASGGTVNKDNCTYIVNAVYSDMSRVDVTESAEVTGSLVVEASQVEHRHSAGTLTLTATYGGFTGSADVKVYQEAYVLPVDPKLLMPLTFNIISGGSIGYGEVESKYSTYPRPIEYSVNDGAWQTYNPDTVQNPLVISGLNEGDVVRFRGNNDNYEYYADDDHYFQYVFMSEPGTLYEVEGNIMSLLNSTGFSGMTELTSENTGAFCALFSNFFGDYTGLISAENLVLPATTLTEFCYGNMFYNCTSLTSAPVLPATTLAENCYDSMFYGCTSLTSAPVLPATTLAENCYQFMFWGCTSLNYIKCLATDISASDCTNNWVYNVASSGTFVKNASMSSWTSGGNGIPSGWTVEDAS